MILSKQQKYFDFSRGKKLLKLSFILQDYQTAVRRGHIVPTMNSSIQADTKGNDNLQFDNLEGSKIILIIFYHEKNENASTALKVSSGLK